MAGRRLTESMQDRQRWSYTPVAGHWDEAFRPSGLPRKHWRAAAVALGRMGFDDLTRVWLRGQKIIQSNGVTYNVYGDPQGKERPWQLDPIPMVVDPDEWCAIERAVAQRARLLNEILRDLYGRQRLTLDRRLPPALVFNNPGFLRACHGTVPRGGVFLHLYAADLARSPDGDWWVIGDSTQAPSGLGYALENRLVSAAMLPALFNRCTVRQLAGFFDAFRRALENSAGDSTANPRLVLLTPGPNNETYFEHSFLARHWGIPLLEGGDLTVRDNRVFLKTLSGLERVDVILRRTDDDYCDPLELRGDSVLGVPGLVQAVRSGHVTVANALGSGAVEAPGLMAFLPGLCRHLLGEDLRMPSVATWWCGDEGALRHVIGNADRLVIKPSMRRFGELNLPAKLDQAARARLLERVEAHANEYVGQEQVALSTVPARTDRGVAPRHLVLRVFAAWDGQEYVLMPGGLSRVSADAGSQVVNMQLGSGSKDTWVLGAGRDAFRPPRSDTFDRPPHEMHVVLPSRAADNFFWLGRYAERVESGVRLVRALLPSLSGEGDLGSAVSLETAEDFLSGLGYLPGGSPRGGISEQRWRLEHALTDLIYDASRVGSVIWNVSHVRRVSWPLKERLSQDTWRVLNQVANSFATRPPLNPELRLAAQMNQLDTLVLTLSAFTGLLSDNTNRSDSWRFLKIGKRIERALHLVDLFLAVAAQPEERCESMLPVLLQVADSSISYRSRFHTQMRLDFVLQLLLSEPANPRSLSYQVAGLSRYVQALPGYATTEEVPPPLAMAKAMLETVRSARPDLLAARDSEGRLPDLEAALLRLRGSLYDFAEALASRHLTLTRATRFGAN